MRKITKKIMALFLSVVMLCSLLVNSGHRTFAADTSMALPNSSVKVVTLVNGVATDLTDTSVLKNGDNLRVMLSWSISNLSTDKIDANTDLYYNLNATGVVISKRSGNVVQNNVAVGTYNIDDKGVLHIFISDTNLLGQSDIKGGLEIDAIIDVQDLVEDELGQVKVELAGSQITVQKSDPKSLPSVSKSRDGGVYSVDGKNYQNFKVYVTENGDADSITFSDIFGAYLTYVPGSMKLDGAAVEVTGSGNQISHTISNPQKGQAYVYTYTAEVSNSAFSSDYYNGSSDSSSYNTAKVDNSNDKSSSSNTFALGNKTWVGKWGGYAYNEKDTYWGITVNDGDSIDISGTKVTDSLPEGLEIKGDVTVKDASGNVYATIKGEDFVANGYTFPDGSVGKYTLEYRADITGSTNGITTTTYKNSVNLTNEKYNIDKTVTADVHVGYEWITKKFVSVDKTNNTIKWESVITIPSTQLEPINLTFKDVLGTGLEYKAGTFSVDYGTTNVTNKFTGDVTATNGEFSAVLGSIKYEAGKDNKIVIQYTTTYDAGDADTYEFINKSVVIDENANTKEATSSYKYEKAETKIVQYKWNDGTTGTQSKWGIQVVNTGQLYDKALNGERVYIYDTPTLKDTDGNVIDAKFIVDESLISVNAGTYTSGMIKASSDDGKTIKFDLTNFILANQYTNYFELKYTVDLAPETVRQLLNDKIYSTQMTNVATGYLDNGSEDMKKLGSVIGNGQATPTVGSLLTKSYDYTESTAPYANYKIDINPNAYDLIEGEGTLSIEDIMGTNLNLDISTIRLVDSKGNEVTGTTSSFNSSTGTLIINNIPDATHCILSYSVLVNVDYEDGATFEEQPEGVDVSNKCRLYATNTTLSSNNVVLTGSVQKSSAWATSEYGSIIVSKHSGITALGDARFSITAYEVSGGAMVENPDYATDYANKGVTIGEFVTESNGKKTVNLLFDILYKIDETKAPDGYVTDGKPVYVIIPGIDYESIKPALEKYIADNNITVNSLSSGSYLHVENYEAGYSISVSKVDQYGQVVPGAEFTLLKENAAGEFETTTVVGVTDENGRVTFSNLKEGTYKVKETKVPEDYDSATPYISQEYTLGESNKTVSINATNTKLTGKWIITKYENGTNTVLENVVFGLYDSQGNLVTKATTDSQGKVVFDELDLGVKYTVKEEQTIAGYILSNTVLENTFTVDALEKDDKFYNTKQEAGIKISKTAVDSTGNDTGNPVEGAIYTLYDENKNIVYKNGEPYTQKTDVNGVATFTDLEFGTYYVRETEAPVGYELDSDFYDVVTINSNVTVNVNRTNKEKTPEVPFVSFYFTKTGYNVDGTVAKPLPGALFELYIGETAPETLVAKAISDKDGKVMFMNVTCRDNSSSDYYKFWLKETEAPNGYHKSSNIYNLVTDADFETNYGHPAPITDKENVKEISLSNATFENYEIEGRIQVTKTDESGNVLENARYAVYKNGATTPSALATTNKNGIAEFTGLEFGATYVVKEYEAPNGYKLSDEEFTIIIGEGKYNNASSYVNGIDNVYVYAVDAKDEKLALNISKQSIAGSAEVEGASLTLKETTSGTVIDTWTSTTIAHEVSYDKLKINTVYTLIETAAPSGYGYSEEISFMIHQDGTVELLSGSDVNAQVNGSTVVMKDAVLDLSLAKVDATSGNRLEDAILQVRDSKGKALVTWSSTTDSDYKINQNNAESLGFIIPDAKDEYVEYIFAEVAPPNAYYKAEDIHFFVDYKAQIYLKDDAGNYIPVANNKITMEDAPFTDDVIISKKEITGGPELVGAHLVITDVTANKEVDSWISTSKSHVVDISKFTVGNTYRLTETAAPDGHLYAESIEFKINAMGKVEIDGSVVTGNHIIMLDNVIDISIAKYTEENVSLSGAVLAVYDESGNKVVEFDTTDKIEAIGRYLKVGTIDAQGKDVLSKYRLTEVKAPFGYKMAEDIYFALDKNGDLYLSKDQITYSKANDSTVKMIDEGRSIYISKVDMANKEELPGAELTVSSKDGVVAKWVSTKNKYEIAMSDLEPNKEYTLTEVTAPEGYEVAESIVFKLDEAGKVYVKAEGEFKLVTDDVIVMEDEAKKSDSATTEETTESTTESTTEATTETSTETTTEVTTGTTTETTTGTTTETSTETSDTAVSTGDEAPIDKMFLLMVMSGLGLVIFGEKRCRKASKRKSK